MPDWREMKNLLCIRPDNIGDVLMTTPAIRAIKQSAPGCRLTLLASSVGTRIAKHVPYVDECLGFDPPWYRHNAQADTDETASLIERLRMRGFDGAIIFNVFSQSPLPNAMLCHMAGIQRVAAYCRENPYRLISDWVPDEEPLYRIEHEVERQLRLVKSLGFRAGPSDRLSLRVPVAARKRVENLLEHHELNGRRDWLVLHPGASEIRRQYPAHLFAETVRSLTRQGTRVVLTGSRYEQGIAAEIERASKSNVISLTGKLDMDELVALLQLAPVLVSNNTGPVHIAAAVRTPAVVLYAATNPQHTPWRVPHRVLPFDVVAGGHSQNVMVRHAREKAYPGSVGMPSPAQVVSACRELLDQAAVAASSPRKRGVATPLLDAGDPAVSLPPSIAADGGQDAYP